MRLGGGEARSGAERCTAGLGAPRTARMVGPQSATHRLPSALAEIILGRAEGATRGLDRNRRCVRSMQDNRSPKLGISAARALHQAGPRVRLRLEAQFNAINKNIQFHPIFYLDLGQCRYHELGWGFFSC